MSDVKALYPIGKTQWAKWGDEARETFNRTSAKGFAFATAVAEANAVQAKHKKHGLFDVIHDVVDAVEDVAEVVAEVAPVVAVAKTVVKTVKGKGKK